MEGCREKAGAGSGVGATQYSIEEKWLTGWLAGSLNPS